MAQPQPKFVLGMDVEFLLTTNPLIPPHTANGKLRKICRVQGWQTVLERGKGKEPYFYPVTIADIELPDGRMVRVDVNGIQ